MGLAIYGFPFLLILIIYYLLIYNNPVMRGCKYYGTTPSDASGKIPTRLPATSLLHSISSGVLAGVSRHEVCGTWGE
jgi:hypothetical protein